LALLKRRQIFLVRKEKLMVIKLAEKDQKTKTKVQKTSSSPSTPTFQPTMLIIRIVEGISGIF
jgi:hypothetical protein